LLFPRFESLSSPLFKTERFRFGCGTLSFCLNLVPKSKSNSPLSTPRSSYTCESSSIFRGKLTAQF
jgi:hypothetical protein